MQNKQQANGSPFATERRAVGASLSVACSLSIASAPVLANSAALPAFHSFTHTTYAAAQPAISVHHLTTRHQGAVALSQTAGSHDLNLASSQANVLASNLGGFGNLAIVVGGQKEIVSLSSKLTGAETVAAEQVLSGGHQTIKIAANGEASGGTIVLNSGMLSALDTALGGSINTLTISHGVKVIDSLGLLSLSGNLDNDGSILTVGANAHTTDTIAANAIINALGGVITSYSGAAGSSLYTADPALSALTSITNNGTISSTGNLSLSAPTVYNLTGGNNSVATISARQNLNLNTISLTNTGLVNSTGGNVNLASNGSALSVVNTSGSIKALAGNINFDSENAAINIAGGNLLSQQINIKAQAGAVSLNADDVSGTINASGDSVHVVTTSNQILGDIDTSGDPGFISAGNIIITGTIGTSAGADLAILAGGNIVSGSKGVLDTSPTTNGNGGNLTLVAGANVSGSDSSAIVASGAGSGTGGLIDLTGKNGGTGAIGAVTSAAGGTSGNGGYIEMVAYAGSASGSGSIILPSKITVNASGAGTGSNGAVTMIAGAMTGTAITSGPIVGGQVQLLSETPGAASGGVTFTNGTSSDGIGGFTGATNSTTAAIVAGAITASKGVTITTGGNATTGQIMSDGSGIGASGTAGGAGGTINITAAGNIVSSELDAFGGGGVGGGTGGSFTGGAGGAGGTIDLTANGTIVVTGNLNVSGGGGGGGAGNTTATVEAGGAGGKAGSVTLSANNGISVSGEVYAYDGGAGGAGGTSTAGAGAGGGGGGSYGGAGGGGAAAVATSGGQNAGCGGGGGSLLAPGGGGAGSTGGGGTATGGYGGGYVLSGAGGLSSSAGSNGLAATKTAGGAGGKASTIKGGAGGTTPKGGGGGISAFSSGDGNAGTIAQVAPGDGTLSIVAGSGRAGTAKAALKFESGALNVTISGAGATYLSDISGQQVDINKITAAAGTVVLSTRANTITDASGGIIDVTGAITAAVLTLSTSGATANIDINAGINTAGTGVTTLTTTGATANVDVANILAGTAATIKSLGTITTTGTGSINATTVSLVTPKTITVTTDATNLAVTDSSAAVTINQGTNTLNLLASTAATSGSNPFTVNSVGQLNVTGAIGGGASSLITLSSTGAAGGVEIAGTVTGGTVDVSSAGSGGITATTTGKITAGVINLNSATSIGTSSEALTVYTNLAAGKGNTLNIATGSTGSAYVTDLGTTDLSLNATSTSSGLLSLTSSAAALNVVQAPFANINLTDISAAGVITLNSGSNSSVLIGNGNGVVTIASKGSILMNANTAGIEGTSVYLSSSAGDVGGEIGLVVNSLNISVIAPGGEVNITTSETGTINFSGGAGVQLELFATGNNATLVLNGNLPITNILVRETGTNDNITTNGTLGISDKDLGYQVQLNPTGNLTVNGNIIADDVALGANKFTGDPVLLGTVLINGTITTDQSVLIADNQSKGITVNSPITGNIVWLFSDAADININAPITTKTNAEQSASFIFLSSSGANINIQPGLTLTATGGITVEMGSGTAAIGTAAAPVVMKAPGINLTFSGDVYVNDSQAVVLTATSKATSGVFQFNDSTGAITVEGALTSGSISITGTSTLSVGARTDPQAVSLTSTGALNLVGSGAINNFGVLSGNAVSIVGSSFSNINGTAMTTPVDASLTATASLSISNPKGALAISGASGSITTPSGANGSLSLSALGAITVGSATTDPLSDITTAPLHSVTINALGNFSIGWDGIDVVPDGSGNGGTINIQANNIVDNGPKLKQAFFLTANGSTATGSTIVLDLPGSGAITTGTVTGDYNISAKGINGAATIEIVSGNNLTANMSNLVFNGTAASGTPTNITLEAAGKLLINGTFTTETGTGALGAVVLSSGSNTAFIVGGASGTTNGIIGQSIKGSSVSISDNFGITINPTFAVQATTANLALNTTNLLNNGTASTGATLTISNSGNITFPTAGTGTYTMSGLIIDSTNGNITIGNDTSFTSANLLSTLEFLAPKGTLTLPSSLTSLTVKAQSSGAGGTLELAAKTFKTSVNTFTADGTTGAGGTIVYISNGGTPINVGGSGGLTFNATNGGSAAGGSITVANSGNLTVDGSGLNLGTGTGANLSLAAGSATAKGILLISDIGGLKQPFGNLLLLSNSATAFSLGGATTKTNGIVDSGITLTGQTITISNIGGAIVQGAGGTLTATGTSKSALNLVAGKSGIGISNTSPLNVSAVDLGVTTSGSAYLTNLNNGAASLDAVSVSKVLDYTSGGSIGAAASLLVPSLMLSVASISPTISTNATTISVAASSGNLIINDLATGPVTINNLTSAGTVSLVSGGAIATSATSSITGGTITLTAGGLSAGNIVIANNLGSITTGTINLTASGKGTISESSKTAVITANTLNLVTSGGLIGASATKALLVDAAALTVNTGSSKTAGAFINNSATSSSIGTATVGGTFSYSGSITAASGPISTSSLMLALTNETGAITTNATTMQVSAASGSVNVIDSQTGLIKINAVSAAAGQITISSGGAITTAATIVASGNITIGAAGNLTVGGNVSSASGNVSLSASGTGSIIESKGIVAAAPGTGTISLTTAGGGIGASTKALTTNGGIITLTAGAIDNVYVTNTDTAPAGSVSLTSAILGSLKFTETNTTAKNTGLLTINSINAQGTATGGITIVSNEQTLAVAGSSDVKTVNGNIILQNTYVTNGTNLPLITIGNNATIHASSTGSATTGNVFFALGAVPTATTVKAGIAPTSPAITLAGSTPDLITFGSTVNLSGSITNGTGDVLTSDQRNLSFSTGKNPATQIVMGNNVAITADPPAGIITQSALQPVSLPTAKDLIVTAIPSLSAETNSLAVHDFINTVQNPGPVEQPFLPTLVSACSVETQMLSAAISQMSVDEESTKPVTGCGQKRDNKTAVSQTEFLSSGASLYAPHANTTVKTPFGNVTIAGDSVAILIVSEKGLAVYDLHDIHKNSIVIESGQDRINLMPGRSALLTYKDGKEFEKINPAEKVGYKNIANRVLSGQHKVFESEFEIFSMVRSLSPVRNMLADNDPAKRKTVGKMIKTAAILSQLSDGVPYRLYAPPEMTASLPVTKR